MDDRHIKLKDAIEVVRETVADEYIEGTLELRLLEKSLTADVRENVRGTVVTCGIDKCKHNDDGLCKAESIYLSEDHACDGGCDDGWVFDEEEE